MQTAVRSPGRQRTQLSLHRTLLEEASPAVRLSYGLRPGDRQSNLRHAIKYHSRGFARPWFRPRAAACVCFRSQSVQ